MTYLQKQTSVLLAFLPKLKSFALACLAFLSLAEQLLAYESSDLAQDETWVYSDENLKVLSKEAWNKTRDLSRLFNKPIQVIMAEEASNTPVGARTSKSGTCYVILNTRPEVWILWNHLIETGKLNLEQAIEYATYHEVGHCAQLAILKNEDHEKAFAYPEHYADLFALNYLSRIKSQDELEHIIDGVIRVRKKTTSFWNRKYSTAQVLQNVKAKLLLQSAERKPNLNQNLNLLPQETLLLLNDYN